MVFKWLKPRLLICGIIVVIVMINPKLAMGFCKSKYLWVMSNVSKNK
jgi:hypothetical protein